VFRSSRNPRPQRRNRARAVVIDACDREIIAWSAIANGGVSGEMVRDLMIAAVERRKRDYARLAVLPDAETILAKLPGWIEDYCEVHPHSGLKFRSPREFIRFSA
jgi:transposase InsO family protein